MAYLIQTQPGEWHLRSPYIPQQVPVPSWLIHSVDPVVLDDLALALGRIYGLGRLVGKGEGKQDIRDELKSILDLP